MTTDNDEHVPRQRGRPRGAEKQQVVQRLIDATEQLLREAGPAELTERKIAAAAGVHERMIHYYFGDKDGLLFDLVARGCDDAIARIDAIDAPALPAGEATYRVIRTVVEAYYDKPWIAKLAVAEIAKSGSAIQQKFVARYGSQGIGTQRVLRIFRQLVERGVYVERVDLQHAAQSAIFVISAPLAMASLAGNPGIVLEDFVTDEWIRHIADLVDCQLAASPRRTRT